VPNAPAEAVAAGGATDEAIGVVDPGLYVVVGNPDLNTISLYDHQCG
jgi:hypothetical protein